MPTLIGTKTARPSRNTNTPSVSIRVKPSGGSGGVAGVCSAGRPNWKRLGRGGGGSWTSAPFGSYSISRTVSAWIGTATTPLRRRRCDFCGAGEPRAHVRDFFVQCGDDLEIGRLRRARDVGGVARLDRTVADLGHPCAEHPVWHRVDRDRGRLFERDRRNIGFIHLELGFDDGHVGNSEQDGSGIVHRPDDDVLAFLDVAARDDAVHWRHDDDLAEGVARRREAGFFLFDLLFARPDFLLTRLELCFADGDVVLRALERFPRGQPFLPEFILSLEVLPRQLERRARLFDGCVRLLQRGPGGSDVRFAALQLTFE